VDEGQLLMTQAERDRLVALKKAKKKLITQKHAAEEIGVTERQVRRLLRKLRRKGDRAVIHELCGQAANRKLPAAMEQRAITILSDRCTGDSGRRWRQSTWTSGTRLR
jgi:predicted transcriptional regulator of viral defense system